MHLRRRELQAYVIGAAVAGTALVFPYWGRAIARTIVPDFLAENVPFFLLPIVWGVWNWLRVRLDPPIGVTAWGGLLGLLLAGTVNGVLWSRGTWAGGDVLLLVVLPIIYALAWTFVVEPINRALGAVG